MFFIPTPPLCFLNLILAKTNCLVKVDKDDHLVRPIAIYFED